MIEETVDQDRPVGSDADSSQHIILHSIVVVNDFHAASAQDIGRPHHDRITDLVRYFGGFLYSGRHSGLRHGDPELVHHEAELITVFSQVDHFGLCAENADTVRFEVGSQVQRCLTAELSDDADRFLLIVDRQHVFESERLKIQLIGCVIIR